MKIMKLYLCPTLYSHQKKQLVNVLYNCFWTHELLFLGSQKNELVLTYSETKSPVSLICSSIRSKSYQMTQLSNNLENEGAKELQMLNLAGKIKGHDNQC